MWAIGKWVTNNILDVLGRAQDTGGSAAAGTVMAKVNKAIDYLADGTYGLSALANGGVKVVKSVQRGVHAGAASGNITINISSVNPAKCHVTIQPDKVGYYSDGSSSTFTYYYFFPRVLSLSSSQLSLGQSKDNRSSNTAQPFSWEIVEYY